MPASSPAPIRLPLQKGLGCAAGLLAVGAGVVAYLTYEVSGGHLGIDVTLVTALLAFLCLGRRARAAPLERVAFRLAFLPAAVPLALVVYAHLWIPLVLTRGGRMAIWEGLSSVAITAPVLLALTVAAGRVLVRAVLARTGDRLAAATRAVAWGMTVAATLLCLVAATRARRPTPLGYVEALPIVARLPALDRRDLDPQQTVAGALTVSRSAATEDCAVELTTGADEPGRAKRPLSESPRSCDALAVRADAPHRLWIVETRAESAAFPMESPWRATQLQPIQVADAVRPPDGFTALAMLGVLVGLGALLRRPRPSTLPAADHLCRDAVVCPGGLVRVDGELLPLSVDAPPVGTAVIAVMASQAASFRTHAAAAVVRVVPGRLAEHRLAAKLDGAALALGFVALAATPLAVALAYLR